MSLGRPEKKIDPEVRFREFEGDDRLRAPLWHARRRFGGRGRALGRFAGLALVAAHYPRGARFASMVNRTL
jgi:hypothetical protein